jgi:Type I restriction enzyme R protein N terminus (HSDR_N)
MTKNPFLTTPDAVSDAKIGLFVFMVSLNLPPFGYTLKKESGRIFILDIIRKKYLVLTPEEWVRQHFIHYLITDLNYPRSLIKVEGGLRFNELQKRSDIVVFSREGAPWMVIECKAPDQKLSQRTLHQASVYNHSLQAKYLTVTNGMMHVCCEVDWIAGKTTVLDSLPKFST